MWEERERGALGQEIEEKVSYLLSSELALDLLGLSYLDPEDVARRTV